MPGFARASLVVCLLLAGGCSAPAPADTSVSVVSERGLLDADIRFDGPVARGDNQLWVRLSPHATPGMVELVAVDATMPAHGHVAHANAIEATDEGFRVSGLDLFMTGRWQLELQLALSEQADSVSLPVDVP